MQKNKEIREKNVAIYCVGEMIFIFIKYMLKHAIPNL